MAEFSKQWVEKNVSEMGWDFDIDKVVSELPKSTMVPYICEGFGFIAIGKDENENIVYYKTRGVYEDDNINWCVYSLMDHNIPPEIIK